MLDEYQRLKILYLKDILEEETDENHHILMPDIVDLLKKKGVDAERKSVYQDIRILQEHYELPIEHERYKRTYRLWERQFEFAELKLIIDAVASSKTLTEQKSIELIDKLKKLCSRHQRETLFGQIIVTDRAKTHNPEVHYNIEALNEAIAKRRWVLFKYFYYNTKKKKVYSRGGKNYNVQPYALIYSDNNYYLLAFDKDNKKCHFRVDRMAKVQAHTWSYDVSTLDAKVDIENYTKYTFSMYGKGELVPVKMRFHNSLVSVVLDRFGHETSLTEDGTNHFTITQPIAVSPQFFAWMVGLGESAEIIEPVDVRRQMVKHLQKMLEVHKEKST